MIPFANVLTDLYLSVAALLGLSILYLTLRKDDPLTRRFAFAVRATMLLFLGRALVVLTGGEAFRFLVLLGASLIPLAVLILTEGLLRRHAPAWAKALVAGGSATFVLLSFVPTEWIDPVRLWGLFLFQIIVFAICGWLVMDRDKATLSGTENISVVRLALSILFFIPMIVVDFGTIILGVPVQISAIGVLTLCWLALTLGSDNEGQRTTVMSLFYAVSIAILPGLLLGALMGGGMNAFVLSVAISLASILLVMIAIDARRQRSAKQSLTIMRHLAEGPTDDPMAFLRGLQGFPRVEGAAIVEASELAGLEVKVLNALFRKAPVLRRVDFAQLDPAEAEHAEHLLERFAASHIMLVDHSPIRLVALSMPSLAASPLAELEVQVVQRMAALIAERRT